MLYICWDDITDNHSKLGKIKSLASNWKLPTIRTQVQERTRRPYYLYPQRDKHANPEIPKNIPGYIKFLVSQNTHLKLKSIHLLNLQIYSKNNFNIIISLTPNTIIISIILSFFFFFTINALYVLFISIYISAVLLY